MCHCQRATSNGIFLRPQCDKGKSEGGESENATYQFSTILSDLLCLLFYIHTFQPANNEQQAHTTVVSFFFVMREQMKKTEGHFWAKLQTTQFSSAMHCPPFSPKQTKNRRRKTGSKRLAGIIIQSFFFFSLCVSCFLLSLSLSLSLPCLAPTQNLHMISYQKATAFPVSVLLTLWRHLLSESKTLAWLASSQNLAPLVGGSEEGWGGGKGWC